MECDAVFYIQKGHVELSVVSKQGKERVVGVLGRGAFLGEGCLAGHPRYLASARASTEAAVARVETATLAKALKDHPELSQRFMAFLLLRNSQVEADLVDQLFNSSEKRLARLLIMLAQIGQEAELRPVVTPISQEVMAARVGTTRSRINYFMNKFRKLGLIEYNGELKVHSSLLNVIIRE
jgi:CRP-like cAMP-binding protein